MSETLISPEGRVNFPNIFKPGKPVNAGDEPKYSITLLFEKGTDLTALRNAAIAAVKEKWGDDKDNWPANLRTPFRDQAERKKDGVLPAGHEAGAIFISARSSTKPGAVDANVNDIIDSSEIYSGCYARISVRPYAYDTAGNRGVAFGLQNVQKTRDGDPLGGARSRPQDDFKPVEGAATDSVAEEDPFS